MGITLPSRRKLENYSEWQEEKDETGRKKKKKKKKVDNSQAWVVGGESSVGIPNGVWNTGKSSQVHGEGEPNQK